MQLEEMWPIILLAKNLRSSISLLGKRYGRSNLQDRNCQSLTRLWREGIFSHLYIGLATGDPNTLRSWTTHGNAFSTLHCQPVKTRRMCTLPCLSTWNQRNGRRLKEGCGPNSI